MVLSEIRLTLSDFFLSRDLLQRSPKFPLHNLSSHLHIKSTSLIEFPLSMGHPLHLKSQISNLYFNTVKNPSGFGTVNNYITIFNNNKYVSKKS